MDKKLYIACLKENFEYLDFWEKYRTPALQAMVTLVQYARNEGKQFPAETLLPHYTLKRADWPKNITAADKNLKSFSAALSKFGITFDHTEEMTILDGIDLGDYWSVAKADILLANTNKELLFKEYWKNAYKLDCLKRAKRIAESDDLIEHIVFSGEYSCRQDVKVFCDHDNQFVTVMA